MWVANVQGRLALSLMLTKELLYEPPNFPSRARIQLITQLHELIPHLTIDPDHQLAILFDLLFWFALSVITGLAPHERNTLYILCNHNVYTHFKLN